LTLVYNCEETPPDDGIMNTFLLVLATIAYSDRHRQYSDVMYVYASTLRYSTRWGKATRVHVHMYVQLKVGASQLSLEKEFSDIS